MRTFILISCLILTAGCGPKITTCISDPPNFGYQCHDKKKNKDFFKKFEESDNDTCLPPLDYGRVLENCKKGGVKITVCIVDVNVVGLYCFNQRTGEGSQIHFSESENYVCMRTRDYLKLLDYCAPDEE